MFFVLGEYYIGLKRFQGTYKWADGTAASFKNWNTGFPQDGKGVVMMLNENSDNGKWQTKDTNSAMRFICECPDGPCARQWYQHVLLSLCYRLRPKNLNSKVQLLDKTDLPVITVAFHHFCTFTLQPFPLVISPMARRAIGEEFSFSVVTLWISATGKKVLSKLKWKWFPHPTKYNHTKAVLFSFLHGWLAS